MQPVSRHLARRKAPGILGIAAVIVGVWLFVRDRAQASAPQPATQEARVEEVSVAGVIEAIDPIAITAPARGRVARVLVDDGMRVRAGALLATLEGTGAKHVYVRAPVAGTIVRREIARGTDIDADAPMFTLARNVAGARIVVTVPEADVAALSAPTIRVSAPAWPDRVFEAKLVSLIETPLEPSRTATVELMDPGHVLPVGTSASVTFTSVVRESSL
jgi:multidrug efflux pump subunit AcrA (membrane-fusion protein)